MEYSISRYEKNLDHDGNIISIFLAVNVSDGTDSTTYEHWLSGDEMALVLADEANLKPILDECFAQGELKMENEIATRPQPTIFMDEAKQAEMAKMIEPTAIATQKTAIVTQLEVEKQAVIDAQVEFVRDPNDVGLGLSSPVIK